MSSNDAPSPVGAQATLRKLLAGGAEIPTRADVPPEPDDTALSRRTALKMLSLTALVGMAAGCTRKPERRIVSMVDRPEYQRPGIPLFYASTWTAGEIPYGIMVKQIDGRPIKVDGLADHPLSQGKSTGSMQASLFTLYDPNRLREPREAGAPRTWAEVDAKIKAALKSAGSTVLVTRANLGPSEQALVKRFLAAAKGARHFTFEPGQDRARREAWAGIYGAPGVVTTQLENARVILSVDADFLGTDGDVLTNSRGFAKTRDPEGTMSRLYVAEAGMSVTGTNADHRLPLRPTHAYALVKGLRTALGGDERALDAAVLEAGLDREVATALLDDLKTHQGAAAVLAGPHLPAAVHAEVAALNETLGAMGKTLAWNPAPASSIASDPAALKGALEAGPDVAILLGVNPVHAFPGGGFEDALKKAKTVVAHGMTENETLRAATFGLPSAHGLECWGDAAPMPGLRTVCQPMIAPLYGGRQEADSLLAWTKALDASLEAADFHAFLKAQWQLDAIAWDGVLRKGMAGEGRLSSAAPRAGSQLPAPPKGKDGTYDLVLANHPITGGGRDVENTWLLETPEPCSKLTWDNAAFVAPRTAQSMGLDMGDMVTVAVGETGIDLPILPVPGIQKDTIVVHVGYGRTDGAGRGNGVGTNAAALGETGTTRLGATLKRAGTKAMKLARTQHVFDENAGNEKRHLVHTGTMKGYAEEGRALITGHGGHPTEHAREGQQIDDPWDYSKGHKWAMAIDMNKCTGCNACMVACQAENNIPVVGKEEVRVGRDMSWIRLDRYESGDEDNPDIAQQPMLCQHCDNAPCELVCPVNATAHSPEGLNDQTYNRCVGTRYCANNCPYKVRRFNFYNYTENMGSPEEELRNNPHVTVRMRGVMEKCTFCIQRINDKKFKASNEDRPLADGEIVTACQQSCPSDAIVFGDVNVPGGRIAKARSDTLAYHVLEELNVRPNVTYRARIRNPHPSLDQGVPAHGEKKGGH